VKSLNLPPFEYKVKKQNGQIWIFDMIRKRYVVLTPEEWVRQHFIHFLIENKGYPAQLIAVEKEIQVCGMKRRFDLVCYDRQGGPLVGQGGAGAERRGGVWAKFFKEKKCTV